MLADWDARKLKRRKDLQARAARLQDSGSSGRGEDVTTVMGHGPSGVCFLPRAQSGLPAEWGTRAFNTHARNYFYRDGTSSSSSSSSFSCGRCSSYRSFFSLFPFFIRRAPYSRGEALPMLTCNRKVTVTLSCAAPSHGEIRSSFSSHARTRKRQVCSSRQCCLCGPEGFGVPFYALVGP